MNFDAFIREGLNQGMSIEDLSKEFCKVLNQVQSENKSKEEKNEYLRQLDSSVYEACKDENYTLDAAAQFATLAAARSCPELTIKELQGFCKSTREALEITIKATKSLHNNDVAGAFDIFNKAMGLDDDQKLTDFLRRL